MNFFRHFCCSHRLFSTVQVARLRALRSRGRGRTLAMFSDDLRLDCTTCTSTSHRVQLSQRHNQRNTCRICGTSWVGNLSVSRSLWQCTLRERSSWSLTDPLVLIKHEVVRIPVWPTREILTNITSPRVATCGDHFVHRGNPKR